MSPPPKQPASPLHCPYLYVVISADWSVSRLGAFKAAAEPVTLFLSVAPARGRQRQEPDPWALSSLSQSCACPTCDRKGQRRPRAGTGCPWGRGCLPLPVGSLGGKSPLLSAIQALHSAMRKVGSREGGTCPMSHGDRVAELAKTPGAAQQAHCPSVWWLIRGPAAGLGKHREALGSSLSPSCQTGDDPGVKMERGQRAGEIGEG